MDKELDSMTKIILVVEDEPAICAVCVRVLESEGYGVDIAENGVIAKDMIGKKDYSLCLIDIRTPVMNGKELYQYILNNHRELLERVVFTTGDVVDDYTQRFLTIAARPFLPKPFTTGELKKVIKDALSRLEASK